MLKRKILQSKHLFLFSAYFSTDFSCLNNKLSLHACRTTNRKDRYKSKLFRLMDMRSVLELHRRTTLSQSEYRSAVLARLHALLKPYILRRLKADVALELPPKVRVCTLIFVSVFGCE